MGKKKQNKSALSAEELQTQVGELKAEGDRFFASKDYQKAIDSYQQALKVLPQDHIDQASLYSNKAACYLFMSRYRDAAKECSQALQVDPKYTKALQRRAVAFENLSLYKQALNDIMALNKTNSSTEETRKTEQRLKDYVAGKRPSSTSHNVTTQNSMQAQQRLQQQQQQRNMLNRNPYLTFQAKVSLANSKETRIFFFPNSVSYADLYFEIKAKFANAGPFVIKYRDAENDLITMTSKQDIVSIYNEALYELDRQIKSQQRQYQQQKMVTIKFQLHQVENESQIVQPPVEEIKERQKQIHKSADQLHQQAEELIEVENWVVEFAHLFKDQLKLETNQRVDLQQIGWDRCQQALDEAIKSQKASSLFSQSIERFKELTAVGLFNWGVAQNYQVQRRMEDYIQQGGQELILEKRGELLEQLQESDLRFSQALHYKDDHFDSILAQAQLLSTKAKIQLGFYLPLNTKEEEYTENGTKEGQDESVNKSDKIRAIQREKIINLVKNIQENDLSEAKSNFEQSHQKFSDALTLAKNQIRDPVQYYSVEQRQGENGEQLPPKIKRSEYHDQSDETEAPLSNVCMSWGNVLFEESLIYAGMEKENWQECLNEAIDKFREGGAKEQDIKAAMKIHTKKDDIVYPEMNSIKNGVKQESLPKEEQVKGLPSLKARKKEENTQKATAESQ